MSKKQPTTRDEIDIKGKLEGKIETVIKNLQALAKKYPGAEVDVYTDYQYGESYSAARLQFTRAKTAIEIERDMWDEKARQYDALRRQASAFVANDTPFPREAEMKALGAELGYFALAPSAATLAIFDGEVLVYDMGRGARRRDGTWVLTTMMGSPEMDKMWEKRDAAMLLPHLTA